MPSSESGSLRERKHDFVRRVLEESAMDLFVECGFENVTIEDIGRHAGVSRRTYFRYFKTKEDAIASSMRNFGTIILERFRAQDDAKEPLAALEAAFASIGVECIENNPRAHRMIELVFEVPQIRGTVLYESSLWVPYLTRELMRRRAFGRDAARCELAACLSLAAFDQAKRRWQRNPRRRFASHLKTTFRQMRQLDCPKG
jgi:AcrR family transcriptional regulator